MTTTNDLITEGITSRQIQYWITSGYLKVANPGSGTSREWPAEEVRVARLMRELTAAGMTAKAAAYVARRIARDSEGRCRYEISPGVWIEVAA